MKVELSRKFYKSDYPTAMKLAGEMSSSLGAMDWPKYRAIMRRYESARQRRMKSVVQFGETLPLPFPTDDL